VTQLTNQNVPVAPATIKQRTAERLDDWRPGEEIPAARLQQGVDAIRRIKPGIEPPRQIIPVGTDQPLGELLIGTGAGYTGPFACRRHPTQPWVIEIGPHRTEAFAYDLITIGKTRKLMADVETVDTTLSDSPGQPGFAYYSITKSGAVITATPGFIDFLPADTNTTIYIPLARVLLDPATSDVIGLWQMQYGVIHFQATYLDRLDC
jgi:hypothetical protein